jgi:hypothetical protein
MVGENRLVCLSLAVQYFHVRPGAYPPWQALHLVWLQTYSQTLDHMLQRLVRLGTTTPAYFGFYVGDEAKDFNGID